MRLYNDIWKATYSLAFYIGLIYILCSFTFFEIELGHPWHFEVHLPEYIPEVDNDPLWGSSWLNDQGEGEDRCQTNKEIEPRAANE